MKKIRGKLGHERIDLGEMVPWDAEGAESIIHGLMRAYDIEEDEKQRKTASGFAWIAERIISIPEKFDTPKKFLVALHEIAHIRQRKRYPHPYLEEYDAEQYAINVATAMGFIKKRSMDAYIKGAKLYVLSYINSDKKVKIKEIPLEIVEWINDEDLNKKYFG